MCRNAGQTADGTRRVPATIGAFGHRNGLGAIVKRGGLTAKDPKDAQQRRDGLQATASDSGFPRTAGLCSWSGHGGHDLGRLPHSSRYLFSGSFGRCHAFIPCAPSFAASAVFFPWPFLSGVVPAWHWVQWLRHDQPAAIAAGRHERGEWRSASRRFRRRWAKCAPARSGRQRSIRRHVGQVAAD